MITEVITPQEQKLIEGAVAPTTSSFIDEMILLSKRSQILSSSQKLPSPPPPPPPLKKNEKGEIDIFISDDRKSLSSTATKTTIPRISLPLPPPSVVRGSVAGEAAKQKSSSSSQQQAPSSQQQPPRSRQQRKHNTQESTETIWNEIESSKEINQDDNKKTKDEEFRRLNRLMFTKEDLELFEKVVTLRMRVSNDDVIRILCRTGRFRENGFPCHGCLTILLNYDIPLANEISLSMESGGRCKECLIFKTKEEWDSISWVRLEWYTQTSDGKLAADIFKSLIQNKMIPDTTTTQFTQPAVKSLSSKLIQKAMDSLVNTVATELSSERNLSLMVENVKCKLESSEWIDRIISLI